MPQCVEALWEGNFKGLEAGPAAFADADITQSSLSINHKNVILTRRASSQWKARKSELGKWELHYPKKEQDVCHSGIYRPGKESPLGAVTLESCKYMLGQYTSSGINNVLPKVCWMCFKYYMWIPGLSCKNFRKYP